MLENSMKILDSYFFFVYLENSIVGWVPNPPFFMFVVPIGRHEGLL